MPTNARRLNDDELVERMRKDIEIELVRGERQSDHFLQHLIILLTILTSRSRSRVS